MKITGVVCHVLHAPIEAKFYYSQGYYPGRDAVLVEVRTDEGLTGWGQAAGAPAVTPLLVENGYAPLLLGKDPRDWQARWLELGGLRGGHFGIISGLEIALLDGGEGGGGADSPIAGWG